MGHVFTPRDFAGGRVPGQEDYARAVQLLRHELSELSRLGIIYGANLNGSTFQEGYAIGSDVDVLVVTEIPEAETCLRALNSSVREATRVPVEFSPAPRRMAEMGFHWFDYLYVEYLSAFCSSGVIGNDPLPVIKAKETWKTPRKEVLQRWESQLKSFSKSVPELSAEYDENHCKFLEKLIRQPVYAAIDLLRLMTGSYPSVGGKPLSKPGCCSLYKEKFPELNSDDLFAVLDVRTKYRNFLASPGSPAEYVALLGEIENAYPAGRRFMEQNFLFLSGNHGPLFDGAVK